MAKQDYYSMLGVAKDADLDTLKKAYRKLAMQYHPDRNHGDASAEQKFKEVSEAYDVLRDDQKRAAYDRFGHAAFENGGGFRGNGAGAGPGGFDFATSGFSEIFEEMFGEFMGGKRSSQSRARGGDILYNMEITLEEAFAGKQATVRMPGTAQCDACTGTGGEKGAQPITCPVCRGQGKVRATQSFFTIERTCQSCSGTGNVIEKPCAKCHGQGRVTKDKTLQVVIPAGVDDGMRIRLPGEGEAGVRSAPSGDVYITLEVKRHRLFHREGANVQCRVPISMSTAALGGSIEIPSIDGSRVKVQIPVGTQTGQQFRLKGKGMSVLRSTQRGDMYAEIVVETPVNLTKKQKELLQQFQDEGKKGGSHSPEADSFFARVKEFFGKDEE